MRRTDHCKLTYSCLVKQEKTSDGAFDKAMRATGAASAVLGTRLLRGMRYLKVYGARAGMPPAEVGPTQGIID